MPITKRSFPSVPEAAADACELVEAVAVRWGLSNDLRERIVLAVGEAMDNAAGHGHGYEPDRTVRFTCSILEGEAEIVIEQEVPGPRQEDFDAATLPEDPLDVRGRGLFLIRTLADRVTVSDEGRRLALGWDVEEGGS